MPGVEMMVSFHFGKQPHKDFSVPASEFKKACIEIEEEEMEEAKAQNTFDGSKFPKACIEIKEPAKEKAKEEAKAHNTFDGKGPGWLHQMD